MLLQRITGRTGGRVQKLARCFSSQSTTFEFPDAFEFHKVPEDQQPERSLTITKDDALKLFDQMATVRRMEVANDALYKQRMIRGFCHLYDGQEAVATGMEAAMTKQDHLITAYRCHGQQYLRGDTLESIFAELMGKETGCSRGKGGSMHLYYSEGNFWGGNGIVGAQIPIGAGLAFANKYKKDGGVSFALMGDGAANQGQVYEAANMAKLWDLPCAFVVENNTYGMGTSVERAAANTKFYTRGDYVPGIRVDGMDVFACQKACEWARDWMASGKGPLFMEFMTYRYHGHSMSDPGTTYRTRDEVSGVRKARDCIQLVKSKIVDAGWATEKELKAEEKRIRGEVNQAVEVAKAQKELDFDELWEDIYVGKQPPFIRMCDHAKSKKFA